MILPCLSIFTLTSWAAARGTAPPQVRHWAQRRRITAHKSEQPIPYRASRVLGEGFRPGLWMVRPAPSVTFRGAVHNLRPGLHSHRLSAACATDPRLRELRVSPDAHPMQEHIPEGPTALFQAMLFYTDHVAGLNHGRESNPCLLLIWEPH